MTDEYLKGYLRGVAC